MVPWGGEFDSLQENIEINPKNNDHPSKLYNMGDQTIGCIQPRLVPSPARGMAWTRATGIGHSPRIQLGLASFA